MIGLIDLELNLGGPSDEEVGVDRYRCDGVMRRTVAGSGERSEHGPRAFTDDCLQE